MKLIIRLLDNVAINFGILPSKSITNKICPTAIVAEMHLYVLAVVTHCDNVPRTGASLTKHLLSKKISIIKLYKISNYAVSSAADLPLKIK